MSRLAQTLSGNCAAVGSCGFIPISPSSQCSFYQPEADCASTFTDLDVLPRLTFSGVWSQVPVGAEGPINSARSHDDGDRAQHSAAGAPGRP